MIKPVAWMLGKDVTTNEQMGTIGWPAIGLGKVVPLYDHAIPEGFAIVPVEPTEAMIEAGAAAHASILHGSCLTASDLASKLYKAMLTAAAKGE